MDGKIEGTRRWKTEEILDGSARTNGPGRVQQSGRRQASMANHDRTCPSRGSDRLVTGNITIISMFLLHVCSICNIVNRYASGNALTTEITKVTED